MNESSYGFYMSEALEELRKLENIPQRESRNIFYEVYVSSSSGQEPRGVHRMQVFKSLDCPKLLVTRDTDRLLIEYDGEQLCEALPGGAPALPALANWQGYCEYYASGGRFKVDIGSPDRARFYFEYRGGEVSGVHRFEDVTTT